MKTLNLDAIVPVVDDKTAVIEAVKHGFIAHSQKQISMPPPVQMVFSGSNNGLEQGANVDIKGDCHIKTAYSSTLPYYCVKIASGFYQNPAVGLPVNNGLVMLFSSETGQPLALFQDDGHLTSVRTAAAGALGVSLRQQTSPIRLGIAGTGHQAELQARWVSFYNPSSQITLWGRSLEKAHALKVQLADLHVDICVAETTEALCANSNVIVTTTPSTEPILSAKHISAGHHIVALGSDSPGKIELDPEILAAANQIVVDDFEQCLHHGEFGYAFRQGLVDQTKQVSLGYCLNSNSDPSLNKTEAITVVDLTGLGAQDLALASMVWQSLIRQH